MPKERVPRLVPLDEKPQRTRRSVYSDILNEFAADPTMRYARVDGVNPNAIVSVKRAISRHRMNDLIAAYTSNGAVVLEKKSDA